MIVLVLLTVVVVACLVAVAIASSRRRRGAPATEAPPAPQPAAAEPEPRAPSLTFDPLPDLEDGATLHERLAWIGEVLGLRGHAHDGVFAELRTRLEELASGPADPHADEREALAAEMLALGLAGADTYQRLLGAYDADLRGLAADMTAALRNAVIAQQQRFVDLTAYHPAIAEAGHSALTTYASGREQLWTALVDAAERVKVDAARAILDADPTDDAALPVRGAAAFCVVDDVAADNLGRAASALLPERQAPPDSASIEDRLGSIEKLFESLERNSVAWAATNAVLLEAVAPGVSSGDALAHSMLGLAGVPEQLALAGNDVLSYLHAGAPHDLALSVDEFVSHAIGHILPSASGHAGLPETLFEQMHHSVSGLLEFKGSLAGQLLTHESFGTAIASYLKSDVQHSAQFFLDHAGHAPQIHDAGSHLLDAGHLTGSAALHGLIGHLPVVTLVLSTCQEIRVRREHDASLGNSVANIAIDVVGVGTGMAAAAIVGSVAGIHGGPLVLLTAPGAIAGKAVSNVVKKKRLARAMGEYGRVREVYDARFQTLVSEFSSSVHGAVAAQDAKYRQAIGAPPHLRDSAPAEVDGLVRDLSAATASYAQRVGALLDTAGGALPQRKLNGARARLDATGTALAACDAELANGEPTRALTSLVDAKLPFAPSWQPSSEFRAACVASAEALEAISGRHREEVAGWADRATKRFERAKAAITTTAESAAQTYDTEVRAAAAPVEAAFATVDRERARLGLAFG